MNDGGYRVPGRDIDATAVEQERIRQKEETRRKEIEQREETKRVDIKARDYAAIIVTRLIVGAVVLGGIIAAGVTGDHYIESHRPNPGCIESSDVVSVNSSAHSCPGGHVETEKLNENQVIFKCRCTHETNDAGHP